jgi:hypothetical protein
MRLWGDLNHADSHTPRLDPARSGAAALFHSMRILPRGPSNSMTHSVRPGPEDVTKGVTSSKNSLRDAACA